MKRLGNIVRVSLMLTIFIPAVVFAPSLTNATLVQNETVTIIEGASIAEVFIEYFPLNDGSNYWQYEFTVTATGSYLTGFGMSYGLYDKNGVNNYIYKVDSLSGVVADTGVLYGASGANVITGLYDVGTGSISTVPTSFFILGGDQLNKIVVTFEDFVPWLRLGAQMGSTAPPEVYVNFQPTVPEPGTLLLVGLGLISAGVLLRRKIN